ncbi:MAG: HAD family hydrolase [Candidatus Nezhaarchaeales archaeon]
MYQGLEVKVISLDVAGTLVSDSFIDYFWLELIPQLFAERHGVTLEESKRFVYSSYDKIGRNDLRWYLPSFWFKSFDLNLSVSEALNSIRDKVEVYSDVRKALVKLSSKRDLVISSNLSKDFIDVALEAIGFRNFKAIFSCVTDLGLIGKTPEFYTFILKRLGVPPRAVLHVGDDPIKDYENPIRVGMKAILIKRSGNATYPYVRDLMELLNILDTSP